MKKKKENDVRPHAAKQPRYKPSGFIEIPLKMIDFPGDAMRSGHDQEKIKDLADSIDRYGLINPIVCRSIGKRYEVVAGARRLHALKFLGRSVVECRVEYGSDARCEIVKIHENLIREDVNIVDESVYLAAILKRLNMGQVELAKMIGKSEAYVSERLKIGKWKPYMKDAVISGSLSFSAARELQTIKDEKVKLEMVAHAVKSGCTPATAKQWADDANAYVQNPTEESQDVAGAVVDSAATSPRFPCQVCGAVHDVIDTAMIRVCSPCKSAVVGAVTHPESI